MRAFARGAPVRTIAAAYVGVGDQYWYVPANSPLKSLADATEKHTMAYSTNGATSHVVALGFTKQLGVKAKLVSTGGPPATYTSTMSGQIDIGWAVVPFGLAALQEGKIRVIARGPDVPTLRNQTIRVQIVNADALKARKDVMIRFMRAYRESLDWMYSNPLAVKYYSETIKLPENLVVLQRDQYNPKEALSPDRLSDIEQVMADAVEMKFLDAPLSKAQLAEFFQIPPPGS
jgi:NitT/TauT family transport system substrate-binding protein